MALQVASCAAHSRRCRCIRGIPFTAAYRLLHPWPSFQNRLLPSPQTSAYWLAPWTVCLTALLFSAGWGALAAAATGLLKAALELGGSHTQLTWNALWAFGGLSAGSCLVVCCFLGSVLLE